MFILGLMGSPRKNGNTDFLLSSFLKEAENYGAKTELIRIAEKNILPCRGCGVCEKKSGCIISDDDMSCEIYNLMRTADVIIAATPIYFYTATAQMKAVIDRSQALWSEKYKRGLTNPGASSRKGFLLALGATKGKNLFDGIKLTAKYFFDAAGAEFAGSLTYRKIENPEDMQKHPSVLEDVKNEAEKLFKPLSAKKKILFACRENACRSQIAAAFARYIAGDKIDAVSAGTSPAEKINPVMVEVMKEKGIETFFLKPKSIEQVISKNKPDLVITMCKEECPIIPGVSIQRWDMPDTAGKPIEFMRQVRDNIESKVKELMDM